MAENQVVRGGHGNAMILAIGTAIPPNVAYQETYPDYYFRVTNTQHLIDLKKKFKSICDKSKITKRYFHLTEEILKKNPNMLSNMAPSFDARQEILVTKIPELAKEAALKAIEEWKQPISKITHLIFCTTAGVDLPSADFRLMELLGLNPHVKRFMLNRQGCSAGGIVLRLAKDLAENNLGARILVVCSESSICCFRGPSPIEVDLLVSEALFGDGASAAIVGTQPDILVERPIFEIVSVSQMTIPNTGDKIKVLVREAGLLIYLSKELPSIIANNMQECLNKAFRPYEISDWNSLFWVAHPGGPKILDLIESRLSLNKEKLEVSRHILSEYGNMVSSCVMFVMDEMRKRSLKEGKTTTGEGSKWGVLCAFGPGVSVETIVLRSVSI